MGKTASAIAAAGLGALAMYLLDPDRGRRRRATVRDKAIHMARVKRQSLDVMVTDFTNRAKGTLIETRHRFDHEHPDDRVLAERVRSALGRATDRCEDIVVQASDGEIILTGEAAANEMQNLVRTARGVHGVEHVTNLMEPNGRSEHCRRNLRSVRWTPATCLLMSVAGIGLHAFGFMRKGLLGTAAHVIGTGMLVKGFSDTESRFDPALSIGNISNPRAAQRNGQVRQSSQVPINQQIEAM